MHDWLDIGATPPMEQCAQVGSKGYWERARQECRAYLALLRRAVGAEPEGASLGVRSHPHDFGTYLTVVCYYDPDNTETVDYALRCESEGPQEWDEQARQELGLSEGS